MPAPYLPPIKSVRTQGQQIGRTPGEHCRGVLILAHPPCLSLTALVAGALPQGESLGLGVRGGHHLLEQKHGLCSQRHCPDPALACLPASAGEMEVEEGVCSRPSSPRSGGHILVLVGKRRKENCLPGFDKT